MSSIKNECPYKVITTCPPKQDTYTIKIKFGDHNHKPILADTNATHRREVIKDDIKLKKFTQTEIDASV